MILQKDNIWYVVSLCLILLLPLLTYLILRNKSEKTIKYSLIGIAVFNFVVHFFKVLIPGFSPDVKTSIIRLSLENICAISTVFLPFAMICKNKVIKTYMYFISFVGGLMAIIIPTDPVGHNVLEFNSLRYYICHYCLLMVPCVAAMTKVFKPEIKHAIWMPFMFLLGQTVIFVNELVLWWTGVIDHNWTSFMSPNVHNPSFVFGPNLDFKWTIETFWFLVPKIFRTNIFNIDGLTDCYMPVLWVIFPALIFFPITYFVLTLPFTHQEIKCFICDLKSKKKSQKEEK